MHTVRQTIILENLKRRARMIDAVRAFFTAADFLEVETPVRIPAPAPEAHIDAEPCGDWFLQTSPELCMKRMVAAGCGKIFQVCRCFRRGERGRRHLPEMTLLEWYVPGWDYRQMMVQCEALIGFVAARLGLGRQLRYRGHALDLAPPWPRLSVAEAFRRFGGISVEAALAQGRFDAVLGLTIAPRLGTDKPVFLHDYPAACGALARHKADDPAVVERFELYIAGLELCNAFSELTDAAEQQARFETENRARLAAGKSGYPPAAAFLRDLAVMPPAAGTALGLDRLAMLFADAADIDEVVAFTPEEL
jgi:lysyl-tRNA synthetase class 2